MRSSLELIATCLSLMGAPALTSRWVMVASLFAEAPTRAYEPQAVGRPIDGVDMLSESAIRGRRWLIKRAAVYTAAGVREKTNLENDGNTMQRTSISRHTCGHVVGWCQNAYHLTKSHLGPVYSVLQFRPFVLTDAPDGDNVTVALIISGDFPHRKCCVSWATCSIPTFSNI